MVEDGPVLRFADRSARGALLVEHAAVLRLCLDWEALADALPRRPGRQRWTRLKAGLAALRDEHLPRIDRALAEIAAAERLPGHLLNHAERLRALSAADADHSHDVEAALAGWIEGGVAGEAETLGYMLRCLFDGCRRTIFAREILLSAIGAPR